MPLYLYINVSKYIDIGVMAYVIWLVEVRCLGEVDVESVGGLLYLSSWLLAEDLAWLVLKVFGLRTCLFDYVV